MSRGAEAQVAVPPSLDAPTPGPQSGIKGAPPGWLVWTALSIVYLVWGSTYLAIRVTVETLPPLLTAGARFLVAGGIAYLFLWWKGGRVRVRVTGREALASTAVGTALLFGGNGMVTLAERSVPSAVTALIIGSVPLWVVLLRAVTGEKIGRTTLVGVVVGFVGVSILVLPGGGKGGASLASTLLIVAASVSWASGSFFSRKLPLPKDPFVSTAVQMLGGGVVLVGAAFLHGEMYGLDVGSFSGASLLAFVYLVVAGSWLAFTAYVWLLQNAPISKVATYAYVNPVVAIFLGWLILNESITSTIILGAAVIVTSVAIIVRREESVPSES
jgi:drug/metabolite transporter (DMT)-like permease